MIDEKILDEVLPVPELEELKEETIQELEQEGFVITNFSSGGVFYTLMMIALRIRIELVRLLRSVLNNMFVSHAKGIWLELKAADFSKKKKKAVKTRGYITLTRNVDGEAIKIPKATVFKTQKDINGDELRFLSLEDAVLQKGSTSVRILIEAEKEGTRYNVPVGQIARSLTHIEGIDSIKNDANWIAREGSDIEDDESLRNRTLNSWAELSSRPIADKYKNVCEAVEGVLFVTVNDLHPRGQGTIDIVVTGTAGEATEALLEKVRAAADSIKGEYDNILVKSSITVAQDIDVVITVSDAVTDSDIKEKATNIIEELLKVSKDRNLNELHLVDVIFALKSKIPTIKNIKFTTPTEDVILTPDKVIIAGQVSVTVQRE
ncbi:baseplate J/gp47 family protein [Bacteroidales bacterium MSK.15.36]|nr:baseplate J/gp47 family protein [Bacteroidales bacterium MSK.15.36]